MKKIIKKQAPADKKAPAADSLPVEKPGGEPGPGGVGPSVQPATAPPELEPLVTVARPTVLLVEKRDDWPGGVPPALRRKPLRVTVSHGYLTEELKARGYTEAHLKPKSGSGGGHMNSHALCLEGLSGEIDLTSVDLEVLGAHLQAEMFAKDEQTINALKSVLASIEAGHPICRPVGKWLKTGLAVWLKDEEAILEARKRGKKERKNDLAVALSLRTKGGGHSPIQQYYTKDVHQRAARQMGLLLAKPGRTPERVWRVASYRKYGGIKLSPESMKKIYYEYRDVVDNWSRFEENE
jgi:hypothetical protein